MADDWIWVGVLLLLAVIYSPPSFFQEMGKTFTTSWPISTVPAPFIYKTTYLLS